MADELKITVSVPGAKQAAQDLHTVAAAEQAVVAPSQAVAAGASQQAAAHGEDAQATEKSSIATQALRIKKHSLLMELAAINPEMAAGARMVAELASAEGGAALGLAGVTAVVAAAMIALQMYNAQQEKMAKLALAGAEAMQKQVDVFKDMQKSVEKQRQKATGEGVTVSKEPTADVVKQAIDVQKQTGISTEQRNRLSDAMGIETLTKEQQMAGARAMVAGQIPESASPIEVNQYIKSGAANDPEITKAYEAAVNRSPAIFDTNKVEALAGSVVTKPGANQKEILEKIRAEESAAPGSRTKGEEEITGYINDAIQAVWKQQQDPGVEESRRNKKLPEYLNFLQTHPEIGELQMTKSPILGEPRIGTGENQQPVKDFLGDLSGGKSAPTVVNNYNGPVFGLPSTSSAGVPQRRVAP